MTDKIDKNGCAGLVIEAWALSTFLYGGIFETRYSLSRECATLAIYMQALQRLRRRIHKYGELFGENIFILDLPDCIIGLEQS